ncbi:putative translation initiation factor eIF-2B subunit delta [Gigaspora margarita]|uniref:Translation initiation factor eIF2B subunit delta n=2 Tax=Gigaspora margarita TaxID=4874 RepID=A0A8H3XI36_GIGMA|nr:putative translation initiation factor eIF-2B subunit delta [Gigaspora margarita]
MDPVKKTAKELKAERRALQERQRAEKAARAAGNAAVPAKKPASGSGASTTVGSTSATSTTATPLSETAGSTKTTDSKQRHSLTKEINSKQVDMFSHLEITKGANTGLAPKEIHPAILVLGLQFSEFKICGANARCIAALTAFQKVIQDYKTPEGTTLSRHLPTHLSPQITYLVNARPMSVGMGNAIRHLKWEISTIDIEMSDDEAKKLLCEKIDNFIRDSITVADRVIVEYGLQKIQDGDVILTYARSSVVQQLLLEAHTKGIKFKVIIIDSRPRLEGKKLLNCLVNAGINCTYAFLHAVGFAMRDVSKVFLGAHAFMSNGALYSRVGTAMVAMMAKEKNIPVIICCETYKFTDKVQLDSFVMNEQGNPNDIVNISTTLAPKPGLLSEWLNKPDLKLLNLLYDLTPSKYITTVITEVGMIPCTSVPVILREYKPMVQ